MKTSDSVNEKTMMSSTGLTLNDIQVGQVFETDSIVMHLDEVKKFAREFDPQPIHLDEQQSAEGPFGTLIASGWHTLSITMKLMAEAKPLGSTQLIGVGVNGIVFKRPVFPGDTLAVRAVVKTKTASTKPGRGFVELRVETRDVTKNECVIEQNWTILVPA